MSGPWSPLESALAAFHDRGEDVAVTVRTDFGPTEVIYPSFFFRDEDALEEWESIALRQCGTRVLDVGAGAGAHALVLQARGHEVTALDLIPEAVRIMRERGVTDARVGTLFDLVPGPTYDTVIILMNGFMIAETLSGLDRLLVATATVLAPGGMLVLDSTDLRDVMNDSTDGPEDSPEDGLEDDDRYIGELHYQLSVGDDMGEVFPQLFVDPDTLDARARRAGWNLDVLWSGLGGRYLARLHRPVGSVTDDTAGPDRAVPEALT